MKKTNIKVMVLMGGMSSEREVSLSSGKSISKILRKIGYNVIENDLDYNLPNKLAAEKPDVVFNALHGTYGEDGCVQGMLEILKIPYTHSNVLSSAICMDKAVTKSILQNHNIQFAEGKVYSATEIAKNDVMERPYVVKPINEGSSVGVSVVFPGDNFVINEKDVLSNKKFLVERYIKGKEIQVGVFKNKALACLEIKPKSHKFYDYETKYSKGLADHITPAPIPQKFYDLAMDWAERAHNILGCKGISRSDMRYDDTKGKEGLYFLEINTHPGFTNLSLLPEIAKYKGISFADICDYLVKDSLCIA